MLQKCIDKARGMRHIKPFILLFCILFSLVMVLGSTLAWFTTSDSVTNQLKSPQKNFSITAVDVFDPDPDENDIIHKRVGAVNAGNKPGFVRLLLVPVFLLESDNPQEPPQLLPASFGEQVSIEDLNTTDRDPANDWIDGGDGYYYYTHILNPGESTDELGTNLFNKVIFAKNLDEQYLAAQFYIQVKCEAVGTKPSGEYINSWWDGVIPQAQPLLSVHNKLKDLA